MRTIYEKEALFENLDAAFAELKEYIVSAVNKEELYPVEQQMFGRLQQMGRQGLEAFVTRPVQAMKRIILCGVKTGHPWPTKGSKPRARPMCPFLAKSGSTARPIPIRPGAGSIRLMRS